MLDDTLTIVPASADDPTGNLQKANSIKAEITSDFATDVSYTGSASSLTATITVTNDGTAEASGLTASLTNGTDFEIEGSYSDQTLVSGSTASITVKLKDSVTTAKEYEDTLTISGDNGVSAEVPLSATINKAGISSLVITGITEPAIGATDESNAQLAATGATSGNVTWSPALTDSKFAAGTEYTASVVVNAETNYAFTAAPSTMTINGNNATVSGNPSYSADLTSLTLTYTFDATAAKEVASISVKNQPTKLSYKSSEKLDLSGLVVTLNYNDSTSEDVAFADFASKGITASIANETVLTMSDNSQSITVTCNGKTANTDTLVISKMGASMIAPSDVASGVYVGISYDLTAHKPTVKDENNTDITEKYTFTYSGDNVSDNKLTAAGTDPVTITVTATPKSDVDAEYNTPTTVTFTVTAQAATQVNPTVEMPTGTVQYGDEFQVKVTGNANGGQMEVDTLVGCEFVSGMLGSGSAEAVLTFKATGYENNASVTIKQVGNGAQYSDGSATGTVGLTPRVVKISGLTVATKEYDGKQDAVLTGSATVANKVGEDDVTLTGDAKGTFASADAGDSIAVTYASGLTLGGAKASYYTLIGAAFDSAVTGKIDPKQLTWTAGSIGATKVYDGTLTNATLSGAPAISGNADGETITAAIKANQKVTYTGTVGVATDKGYTVTASMFDWDFTTDGGKESNYKLPTESLNLTNGTITQATLSISATESTASVSIGNTVDLSGKFQVTGLAETDTASDKYTIGYTSIPEDNATIDATTGIASGVKMGNSTITATLNITDSTNYKLGTNSATVILTVNDKTAATVTLGAPSTNPVYDGAAITKGDLGAISVNAGASVTPADAQLTFEYKAAEGSWTNGFPTNAGTYAMRVTFENDQYKGTSDEISVTIGKAQLTWDTSKINNISATKVYDGTGDNAAVSQTGGAATLQGLGSDAFSVTLKADQTAAYTGNSFAVGNTYVYSLDKNNFDIVATSGSLSNYELPAGKLEYSNGAITAKPVTLSAKDSMRGTAGGLQPKDFVESADFVTPDNANTVYGTNMTFTAPTLSAGSLAIHVYKVKDGVTIPESVSAWSDIKYKDSDGNDQDAASYTDVFEDATGTSLSSGTYYVTIATQAETVDNYSVNALTASTGDFADFAKLAIDSPPIYSGGSVDSSSYTVTYKAGENGKLVDENDKTVSRLTESVKKGEKPVKVPEAVADEGYKFAGWSTDGGKTFVNPAKMEIKAGVTFTAIFKEYTEHTNYMQGYPDGTFQPNGSLTRAEAATMLARLTPGFEEGAGYESGYPDIQAGDWYANHVGFASGEGIVTGYDDGEFKGGQSITRGEFAAMLARYIGLEAAADLGGYPFSDAGSHWAQGYIQALYNAGILGGYPDGTFRPDAKITRAEAAKMVNAALGRTPDGELVSGAEPVYADVSRGEWYYGDVMEASVVHEIEAYHKQETKN